MGFAWRGVKGLDVLGSEGSKGGVERQRSCGDGDAAWTAGGRLVVVDGAVETHISESRCGAPAVVAG